MVVAEAVVTNQENDSHQLVPMLDEVKENVGEIAEENLADAGYDCTEQYAQAEQRGYEVLVSARDPIRGSQQDASGASLSV